MGATDFQTTSTGKTVGEAFRSAQEDARYAHGHAGYTGTIAEKSDYSLFTVPPRTSIDKLVGWVYRCDELGLGYPEDDTWWATEVRRLEHDLKIAKPGTKRPIQEQIRVHKKRLKEHAKEAAKFKREVGALLPTVIEMSKVYSDKWGAAVAIEITSPAQKKKYIERMYSKPKRGQKVFVFFGLASC